LKTNLKIKIVLILTNSIILLFFGLSIYYFLYNYSYNDFYKRIETRAHITARYNNDLDKVSSENFKKIKEEFFEKLSNETEFIFHIRASYDSISNSTKLPIDFIKKVAKNGYSKLQINEKFLVGIKSNLNKTPQIIIVSAENYFATHHLIFIRNIIFIGIFLIILITIYLSFYFSKHIFDPIKNITEKVKIISTDNFHLRLEEKTINDPEINLLIETFNSLLDRLETSFETQKNFISNASHEFGTPLTSIIGEAEVTLRKDRKIEEYKESLMNILEQADRISQISQSLLYLAQTAYKENKINFEITRSDELIWEVKKIIDKINPKNKIEVDLSLLPENPNKLKINANKQLLILAFVNILSNASKYSNNKIVSISIASTEQNVIIAIKDQGVGIPESEIPFIYDPFFRASNTSKFEGYGIGLPLARNIIKIHSGKLDVQSKINTGTTVIISIPLANIQTKSN
jgi:signal transduction histidine kinase